MAASANGIGLYGNASTGRKFETIDLSTGAVKTFTPPTALGEVPQIVIFAAQGGDYRFRVDGTNPSSTVGFLIKENNITTITASATELARWKFIQDTGSTGVKLNVHYFTYANANEA